MRRDVGQVVDRVLRRSGKRLLPSRRPTLSLCVVTRAAPEQARGLLEAWRPAVDEIVLAKDERADAGTLAACAELADRLAVVPAATHMERYLGWLHGQCSGDWILRADDDELPSADLLNALPELLVERELTHFWLPRRWVYPTAGEYIAEGAWATDIQLRLVRNVPGLWRFQGRLHTNIEVLGASRVLDVSLLHVIGLLSNVEQRRRKAEAYERLVPGLTHESGESLGHVYLPEEASGLRRERLSAPDERRIATFLERTGGPRPPCDERGTEVARPTEAELTRWLDDRAVSPGAYRARVRLVNPAAPMPAESLQHVQVEVTNLGDDWWPRGPEPEPEIAVGHRWYRTDGTEIVRATPRTAFTETVAPGGTTRLTVALQAPPEAGELELRVDVVHERVRWFDCPASQIVKVLNR